MTCSLFIDYSFPEPEKSLGFIAGHFSPVMWNQPSESWMEMTAADSPARPPGGDGWAASFCRLRCVTKASVTVTSPPQEGGVIVIQDYFGD